MMSPCLCTCTQLCTIHESGLTSMDRTGILTGNMLQALCSNQWLRCADNIPCHSDSLIQSLSYMHDPPVFGSHYGRYYITPYVCKHGV